MIDINKMMKLTSGQGHKVKGQDEIFNHVKILVSTIYNEPMIGFCFMILEEYKLWILMLHIMIDI